MCKVELEVHLFHLHFHPYPWKIFYLKVFEHLRFEMKKLLLN
ncbi:102R [Invertebrate iridescent virus Kaz2018]|uniref:102R n=1 Tax=Invertebrate iridescent virus 6 TaxID=176652 RepID=Q91G18_IIV6|nr:102R [Invertebrate iridescent virus 6]AAK82014.1 102R [Invertebrate iridescent virus 6]QNH08512.1 102R [Invertebrate iridescent virus Kaz2018]